MTLKEVLEWLKTLNLPFESYYMGTLDKKKEKSLGVYNLKRSNDQIIAIGGLDVTSYNVKKISLLIHWNKAQNEAEQQAMVLYRKLEKVTPSRIGSYDVNYIRLLTNEAVDVGRDEQGICEFVIEFEINYKRKKED